MGGIADLKLATNYFPILLPQRRGHGPDSKKLKKNGGSSSSFLSDGASMRFFSKPSISRKRDSHQILGLVGLKEPSLVFRPKAGGGSNFGVGGAKWPKMAFRDMGWSL